MFDFFVALPFLLVKLFKPMVLNYIWLAFFLVAFVVALVRTVGYFLQEHFTLWGGAIFDTADRDVFVSIVDSTFSMAETSVTIAIYLIGVMTLWLGIMKIGENGGAVSALSRVTSPLFRRLFPEIPDKHPAMGAMLMNICANMLGLDNAATPLGLKAMKELQAINPESDRASNAQIMFLVLNTSGLTLIPISIFAYRVGAGPTNPTSVFLPLMITTFFSTLAGLIAVSVFQRKVKLFDKVVLAYLGAIIALIVGLVIYVQYTPREQVEVVTRMVGNFLLFLVIVSFLYLGWRRRINLYESFIEGAKDGFSTSVKIIPYLVAMLVGIGVFRASGAMDFLINGIGSLVAWLGLDTQFVPALPTAFMKPLSGSGARGMMLEAMSTYGADSFVGQLVSIFQGSTETTFYTVAVYFGVVGVRKTRYTIGCGLIADLAGALAAIFVAYLFFG